MAKLTINGKSVDIDATPDTPLLWAIRDHIGLTGTKYGCGVGQCGSCTVHIDGEAVRSCSMTLGSVKPGQKIVTIEGLSPDSSHPIQKAWLQLEVPQCGYCQSGMIMAAAALLAENKNPSDSDIDATMTNICRCGTYPRIREAIRQAGRIMRGEERVAAAPPPGIAPADAARQVPGLSPVGKRRED